MNSECLCPSPGRFLFYVRRGAAGPVVNQWRCMVGTDVVCKQRWSFRKLAHSLALLQAPFGVLPMGHSYLRCLWASGTLGFSGTFCLMTSSCRIRCGQMGEVPASPSWSPLMFISSQQPERGTGSIARFSSRSRSGAPHLILGWGQYDTLDSHQACLAHSLQRKKPLPYSAGTSVTFDPVNSSPRK